MSVRLVQTRPNGRCSCLQRVVLAKFISAGEDNLITRGPEGIYTRPSDQPGFGWDFEAV